jgi:hypothetical protein
VTFFENSKVYKNIEATSKIMYMELNSGKEVDKKKKGAWDWWFA